MYDFSQPVIENIRLKGHWDCTKPIAILTHTGGSGTVRIRNPWNSAFKIDSTITPIGSYRDMTFTEGDNAVVEIYSAYNITMPWRNVSPPSALVTNLYGADCEFELNIPRLEAFSWQQPHAFHRFNYDGAITSLSSNTFTDFNVITTPGAYFFAEFNNNPKFQGLPEGSFDTSNITSLANNSFYGTFGYYMDLPEFTSLPEGSFQFTSLTTMGDNCLWRPLPQSLTSIPDGSFQFPALTNAGDQCVQGLFYNGSITTLPEGTLSMPVLETAGINFMSYTFMMCQSLESLPDGIFQFPSLTSVGANFGTMMFKMTENMPINTLPNNSFTFPALTTIGARFFEEFHNQGGLQSLGAGSFRFPVLENASADYFFYYFNHQGALQALPAGSFNWPSTTVFSDTVTSGMSTCMYGFNQDGSLTKGNEGVSFAVPSRVSVFDVGDQYNLEMGTIVYINSDHDDNIGHTSGAE